MNNRDLLVIGSLGILTLYALNISGKNNPPVDSHFECLIHEDNIIRCTEIEGSGENECTTSYDCPCGTHENCGYAAGCFYNECVPDCGNVHAGWEGNQEKTVFLSIPNGRCAVMAIQGVINLKREWWWPWYGVIKITLQHWTRNGDFYEEVVFREEIGNFEGDYPISFNVGYSPVTRLKIQAWNDFPGTDGGMLEEIDLTLF